MAVDPKRSAAAKKGWANHCAGTARRQTAGSGARTRTKAAKAAPKPKAKSPARSAEYEAYVRQLRGAGSDVDRVLFLRKAHPAWFRRYMEESGIAGEIRESDRRMRETVRRSRGKGTRP